MFSKLFNAFAKELEENKIYQLGHLLSIFKGSTGQQDMMSTEVSRLTLVFSSDTVKLSICILFLSCSILKQSWSCRKGNTKNTIYSIQLITLESVPQISPPKCEAITEPSVNRLILKSKSFAGQKQAKTTFIDSFRSKCKCKVLNVHGLRPSDTQHTTNKSC